MVVAGILTTLLVSSFVARLVMGLAASAFELGSRPSVHDVVALIGAGGLAAAGAFLLAGVVAVASVVLIAVAGVRLHKGDRDMSMRILFADYVVLLGAAALYAAFTVTGGLGIVRAVGAGVTGAWSWLLLVVCGGIALALCYRLFFKGR